MGFHEGISMHCKGKPSQPRSLEETENSSKGPQWRPGGILPRLNLVEVIEGTHSIC